MCDNLTEALHVHSTKQLLSCALPAVSWELKLWLRHTCAKRLVKFVYCVVVNFARGFRAIRKKLHACTFRAVKARLRLREQKEQRASKLLQIYDRNLP